ncbi:spermidine synthase [Pseudorhodoferax sp.]|uniref:spermidine synthase n=1 Tax=Pseudorhodoferax sp. TaxID=1993553 RepID=UPI0039E42391
MPLTLACGATIVLSSFLLFLVQPLVARQILPWFGGSAVVWSVSMVFFQSLLLAGYLYAHWLQARPRRLQRAVHLALLAAALAVLPIVPDAASKPAGDGDAAGAILVLLLATVGLPYLSLAATSPLLQRWLSQSLAPAARRQVYRLFAWSNAGALAALLAYPFLVEPWFDSLQQSHAWSWAYGAFALACAGVAWQATAPGAPAPPDAPLPGAAAAPPGWGRQAAWVALAALPSALLLAVTAHMTQNIAAIPFLWIVPLALYLLSFMLVFEGRGGQGWYLGPVARRLWLLAMLGATVAMAWGLSASGGVLHIRVAIPLFAAGLFLASVVCHGELAALRPAPRHLTRFYLCLALGGAIGGLGVGLLAPRVLSGYWELPGLLLAAALAGLPAAWRGGPGRGSSRALALLAAGAAVAGVGWYGVQYLHDQRAGAIASVRSAYGLLRVTQQGSGDLQTRRLLHGGIMHGEQFTAPERRRLPTSYYGPRSGIGLALAHKAQAAGPAPVRVGAIGLGTGTLLSYARPADAYVVYELDPQVVQVARRWFRFVAEAAAAPDLRLGDARLSMERELAAGRPGGYDVIAVDAFSSDAIPVHLLTREALQAYLGHLRPDGLVAFHVSNRYLDLAPVVARLAEDQGLSAWQIEDSPDEEHLSATTWVLVARSIPEALQQTGWPPRPPPDAPPWTDGRNGLFRALRF